MNELEHGIAKKEEGTLLIVLDRRGPLRHAARFSFHHGNSLVHATRILLIFILRRGDNIARTQKAYCHPGSLKIK
jgi:hypothetical protein